MRLAVLLATLAFVGLLVPAVTAQSQPFGTVAIELQLGKEVRLAAEPGWAVTPVEWKVSFSNAAAAEAALADGKATLSWSLDGGAHEMRLGNATTPVPLPEPGQPVVSGVAGLGFQAAAGTPGMEPLPCGLKVRFSDSAGTAAKEMEVQLGCIVDFVDGLAVTAPRARQAGPQKQIPFAIDLSNGGNSRTRVDFEMDQPGGMWNAILPEAVVLEPGGAATAVFVVLTPFRDGYNSAGATFTLRALPAADADPSVQGEPQSIEVQARTEGWYVPGPSPLLALAALAGAASVLRRRG